MSNKTLFLDGVAARVAPRINDTPRAFSDQLTASMLCVAVRDLDHLPEPITSAPPPGLLTCQLFGTSMQLLKRLAEPL